ncbi:MAG: SDR family NAD(P)-dependent oxidoreductase, partial [Saprospiraceae bacterium]|nr:SDR family NAD(P)-dependent oxidoreductase [Saprospiraceae bacterium]
MVSLNDKKVLIVGATGGIGSEAAALISKHTSNLFLTGRRSEELKKVADRCEVPEDQVFQLDITQPGEVASVAEKIHDQIGALDVLVNAAGIGIIKKLDKLEPEEFSQNIDVNLKGTFYLLKSFLPPM